MIRNEGMATIEGTLRNQGNYAKQKSDKMSTKCHKKHHLTRGRLLHKALVVQRKKGGHNHNMEQITTCFHLKKGNTCTSCWKVCQVCGKVNTSQATSWMHG